jgi:hypothetical protein
LPWLSVFQNTTWELLKGVSWDLTLGSFSNICFHVTVLVKIWQRHRILHTKTFTSFCDRKWLDVWQPCEGIPCHFPRSRVGDSHWRHLRMSKIEPLRKHNNCYFTVIFVTCNWINPGAYCTSCFIFRSFYNLVKKEKEPWRSEINLFTILLKYGVRCCYNTFCYFIGAVKAIYTAVRWDKLRDSHECHDLSWVSIWGNLLTNQQSPNSNTTFMSRAADLMQLRQDMT